VGGTFSRRGKHFFFFSAGEEGKKNIGTPGLDLRLHYRIVERSEFLKAFFFSPPKLF
jgi:hypothetical protein